MRVATAEAPRTVAASDAFSNLVVEGSETTRLRIRGLLRADGRDVATLTTIRELGLDADAYR